MKELWAKTFHGNVNGLELSVGNSTVDCAEGTLSQHLQQGQACLPQSAHPQPFGGGVPIAGTKVAMAFLTMIPWESVFK